MGAGSWFRRQARKAKKAARKAGKTIERTGRQAVGEVAHTWDKATDPMERLALKAETAIKEGIREMDVRKMIRDELSGIRDGVKREIIDEIRREVVRPSEKFLRDTVIEQAKRAGSEIEKTFEDRIPEAVCEKLPDALEDFAKKMAAGVAREGLRRTKQVIGVGYDRMVWLAENKPALVDEINDLGGQIEIGPMTLSYANYYDRLAGVMGVLDHYINEPPTLRRRDILAMVRALGPDVVDFGVSVQVVALVIGSKELGFGGGFNDVGLNLFLELADAIMAAAGIPE